MVRMDFMFQDFRASSWFFLILIVVRAIFFSVNGVRRRKNMRRYGSGESRSLSQSSIQHRIMRLALDHGGVLSVPDLGSFNPDGFAYPICTRNLARKEESYG